MNASYIPLHMLIYRCTSDISKREGRAMRVHVTPNLIFCKGKKSKLQEDALSLYWNHLR